MFNSMIMISIGGALGCLLRWWLGLSLNALFPYMPLGTFAANCLAGYLIGVAMAMFLLIPALLPWKLFIITGFLGGLSTFSSFSAEIAISLQEGRLFWAGTEIVTHVVCSIVLTILGMMTVNFLR